MQIYTLPVGDIGANCYCVSTEDKQAVIIDPGAEADKISAKIHSLGLDVKYLLLTHGHLDHIGAVEELRRETGARVLIHELDAACLTDPKANLSAFFGAPLQGEAADALLQDGQEIKFGSETLTVLHTPGHTRGGICLKGDGLVFTGDTLFAGSVGRTDFPGGSMDELLESIQTKLLTLDPATKVYPGHGQATTLEEEQRTNPYL